MDDKKFLIKLKEMLERYNQPVADIEMTSGNYDNNGKEIAEQIPTITTDFCEIGRYHKRVTYFTIILYSESFSKALFRKIKNYKNMHIYGFKNFLEDLYPKEDFSYEEFAKELEKDKYVQIQFNFQEEKPEDVFDKYLILFDIFKSSNVQVVDQIAHDLKKESS